MKVPIVNLEKKEIGKKELPKQFHEPVREDLIYRAITTIQANSRQPYGAYESAGMNVSAKLSRRRRDYKGSYGYGMARTPRKVLSHRGSRFNYVGALAPNTRGGRRAHPPKSERIWDKKINKKERRKAICSALAATLNIELIKSRGHKIPDGFPFIVSDEIESLSKTKDVLKALNALGFKEELKRNKSKKIRSGKGKNRARPYKIKKSILFVVSKKCPLIKSADNIPGVDVATFDHLNTELLAPGIKPGRLTLYTESAIDKISKSFKY
ncbi:MAG: 50S ribosomal protein L4 [Candidatus Woesearchaeota archaeon]